MQEHYTYKKLISKRTVIKWYIFTRYIKNKQQRSIRAQKYERSMIYIRPQVS